jgi:AAA+ ATPase superfamily predicted ATPase
MSKRRFINREDELSFLERCWSSEEPQLLVVYGRRRVGKTALLARFGEQRAAVHYLATRLPEAQQLRELGRELGAAVNEPLFLGDGFSSWDQLFAWMAGTGERTAVMIDEFPYLVEANPALPSLLQRAWDRQLSRSSSFLVLCGSSIAMMEREVLAERAPLYGRRTGQLRVRPLSFGHAAGFLDGFTFADQVRAWSMLGGVPYYLLLFDSSKSLEANLHATFLDLGAPLRDEVEFLLRQELREPRVYFGILTAIAAGKRKLSEILNATGLPAPTVSKYLAVLQGLDLVVREVPATEPRPEKSKKGLYAIADPFVRFWFRHIMPGRALLETGRTDQLAATILADLDRLASEAYEEICRDEVRHGLLDQWCGVAWERVGRWWDPQSELDILAFSAADGRATLLGEVKWSRRPVGRDILADLEAKAARVAADSAPTARHLTLFSRSGFTAAVLREAASRSDLHLFHGLDLVDPSTGGHGKAS